MDYGLVLFTSDRGITPAAAAKLADDHGFPTFYVPEHTHIPIKRQAAHPTTGDESLPDDRYMRTLDPWVSSGHSVRRHLTRAAFDGGGTARRARPDHVGEIDRHAGSLVGRACQPRRRIRLEHRRTRRPQRAAGAATHDAARVPRGHARIVDRGRGVIRRRVRRTSARAGRGPSPSSRTSRCWSAPRVPRRTSSGSPALPMAGSPRRATSTSTSRSSCCRTPGRRPDATGAPQIVALGLQAGSREVGTVGRPRRYRGVVRPARQVRGRGRGVCRAAGRKARRAGLAPLPHVGEVVSEIFA